MENYTWFINFGTTTEHLGSILDKSVQRSLENESRRHGDLVQGDFVDSYHNLSYKGIMGNLWVAEFCEQADFVVKTDDDLYYDLFEVDFIIIINLNNHLNIW